MLWGAAIVFFVVSVFDMFVSADRLKAGSYELGPLVRRAVKRFGVDKGLLLGLLLPNTLVAILLASLGWSHTMAFLLGGKLAFFAVQLSSKIALPRASC